jgi:hypothetical protein
MKTGMEISLMNKGAVVKIINRFRQEIEARGVIVQKIILYGCEWDERANYVFFFHQVGKHYPLKV